MKAKDMQENIIFFINPFAFELYKDWDAEIQRWRVFINDFYSTPNLGLAEEGKGFTSTEKAIEYIIKECKFFIKELQKSLKEIK